MAGEDLSAAQRINAYIADLGGWQGEMLSHLRMLIANASPELVEMWKWETPVWSYKGNVIAVGAFKNHLKVNFFQGAMLDDPHGLFNAGLESKSTRSIDLYQGDSISEIVFTNLV